MLKAGEVDEEWEQIADKVKLCGLRWQVGRTGVRPSPVAATSVRTRAFENSPPFARTMHLAGFIKSVEDEAWEKLSDVLFPV